VSFCFPAKSEAAPLRQDPGEPPTKPEPKVKGARLLWGFVKRIQAGPILQRKGWGKRKKKNRSFLGINLQGFSCFYIYEPH